AAMQRMRRFSRFWDVVANSGNFVETLPLIWAEGRSPFHSFMGFSDWMFARLGRQHAIALQRVAELLFNYLTEENRIEAASVAAALWRDYQRGGRPDVPDFLRPHVPRPDREARARAIERQLPARQSRHIR
ncbi:MAG TPA: DUF4080 domain-containing protein, partial [Tepidisphaeraceae bacterium]|nr:DUF4080 domain-containing protein [Tepidisphaeraceae bacterium]